MTSSSESRLFYRVSELYTNREVNRACKHNGVTLNSVTWEDTGRDYKSCLGSNITDMTLQVNNRLFPFIRQGGNYEDLTFDMPANRWKANVSNMDRDIVESISLKELLGQIDKYLDVTVNGDLWLARDEKILTTAQTCILPLQDGEVEFNVCMYNYQYSADDPATLAIVVSPHGTSVQLLTTARQKIYFNDEWNKANYKAKRLEDVRRELGKSTQGPMDSAEKAMNALFIFQVPLKQERRSRSFNYSGMPLGLTGPTGPTGLIGPTGPTGYIYQSAFGIQSSDEEEMGMSYMSFTEKCCDLEECYMERLPEKKRGMDNAQLFVGSRQGKWDKGSSKITISRNPDLPIRCTIQFYRVTDSTDINDDVIAEIAEQITKLYKETPEEDKGSLVLNKDTGRVTEGNVDYPQGANVFFSF